MPFKMYLIYSAQCPRDNLKHCPYCRVGMQQFTTLMCCHPNGHLLCYKCFTRLDVNPHDNLKHCPYCRVGGILSLANKQYAFQNVFNLLYPMST